jgi:hypothetical protein
MAIVKAVRFLLGHRDRKRKARQRELHHAQLDLRRAMLQLASELSADAHEARRALIRESFLTSGKTPPRR